ncbi:MAG: type I DNA topoisomerase [Anaeroplasmataceae bacterium]
MKNVIIVESPAKTKVIEKYMGKDFKVISSYGHFRDLSVKGKGGLGIDIENDFKPDYVISKDKEAVVNTLKKECKGNKVFLATDPDREGEAIAYHLAIILELDINDNNRIVFNEVTKDAVLNAYNNPRKIDMNLVKSQETRRMLDRIIGFKVSSLLQKKIKSKSAGRVQSVALGQVVKLEEEIQSFVPVQYFEFEALFDDYKLLFESYKNDSKRVESESYAKEIYNSLSKNYECIDIQTKPSKNESKPPFTTSTLQQDSSNKLNFNSKRTMSIAQKLYEGIDLGVETVGLITYMRTDSTHLSDVFVNEANAFIEKEFGNEYLGKRKEKKQALAQQAHEAIRPTSIFRTPDSVKSNLKPDEFKLYKLVYERTIASLMAPSLFDKTKVQFKNNDSIFKITGQSLKFDGYLKVYGLDEDDKNKLIPNFKIGEIVTCNENVMLELFTKPKSRFTEATLIKEMEELGIGRPSTYSQIMSTLQDRDYIVFEGKKIHPTEQGIETTKKLDEFFKQIFNVEYTSNMESKLDDISKGLVENVQELKLFYSKFEPIFNYATENMEKKECEETGEICPSCGSNMVFRKSKYGVFESCSNYPSCKYIKEDDDIASLAYSPVLCPKCKTGHLIAKKAKSGKNIGSIFYSCDSYPKCKTIYNDRPLDETCPKCGSIVLVDSDNNKYCSIKCDDPNRDMYEPIMCPKCNKGHLQKKLASRGKNAGNHFYACDNFPKCKNIYNEEPQLENCKECNSIMTKNNEEVIKCSNAECNTNIK